MKCYALARKASYTVLDAAREGEMAPHPDMFGASGSLFATADDARHVRAKMISPSQDYVVKSMAKEWVLWLLSTNDIPRIVDSFGNN